jgi:glycosyltransferase involved in cell wall biosynthesis
VELKNLAQERSVARLSDLVCFQSHGDEQDWLTRVPQGLGKTVIIPGAISGPRFRTGLRDANRSETLSRLVYVGLVSMSKGITYLIEALGELKKRGHSELSLVILGRGGMVDACKRRCAELGIEHQVTFTGQVPDPFPYLIDADLMVYPSLYDAFPDAVLECLHVGIPVIASRIGGIPDILVHDELMFPIMNPIAIADRIEMLLLDPVSYHRARTLCAERRSAFEFDWAERWERAMLENVSGTRTTS